MKFSTTTVLAGALSVLALGRGASVSAAPASPAHGGGKSLLASLSKNEKGLFDESMALMDPLFNATTNLMCVLRPPFR